MRCNKCDNQVELIQSKDRSTGRYSNKWVCEEHGTVDPTDRLPMPGFEWIDLKGLIVNEDGSLSVDTNQKIPINPEVTSTSTPD